MSDHVREKRATIIYPHQLFRESPALSRDCPVVLAEDPWFFKRYQFHAQKLLLHRASMRRYLDHLVAGGFRVEYIEAAALESSSDLFVQLARERISEVHLCDPLETGLNEEIEKACSMQGIRLVTYESPMFLCSRDYLAEFYRGGRRFYLTEFYIAQRNDSFVFQFPNILYTHELPYNRTFFSCDLLDMILHGHDSSDSYVSETIIMMIHSHPLWLKIDTMAC